MANGFSEDENRLAGIGKGSEATCFSCATFVRSIPEVKSISELLTFVNFWNGDFAKEHVFQTD